MPVISSFLFLGTKPHFHIQGNPHFPSFLSTLLSLLFLISSLFLFLSYFLSLLSLSDLTIATTIFKDIHPLRINLSDPNFVFTFGLQHSNYSNFIDESAYTVSAFFVQSTQTSHNLRSETKTPIPLVRCSQVYIPVLPNYFNSLPLDQLYCLNELRSLYLEGSISASNWSYIEVDFMKCRGVHCHTDSEVTDMLNGGYVGFFMSDYFANPSNHEHPAQLSGMNYYSGTSVMLYTELWLYFQTIQFETDDNWFVNNNKTEKFFSAEKQFSFKDHRHIDDVFLKVYLRASESRHIYYRKYGKIDIIVAKVYCIVRVVGFVLKMLTSYFEGLLYKSFVCSFYSFDYGAKTNASHSNNGDIKANTSHVNMHVHSMNENNNVAVDCLIKKSLTLKQHSESIQNGKKIDKASSASFQSIQNGSHEPAVNNVHACKHQLQILPNQYYQPHGSYLSSLFRKRDMVKQPREYGYKTNAFGCCELIRFCLCNTSVIRKVRFVEKSARNINIYFDIIRYLKLFSDVDAVLKTVFEDKQCKQIERSYNLTKNSEFTVKFFARDFKNETKNNQKSMMQNIFFANGL